jgi:hypothetical protein
MVVANAVQCGGDHVSLLLILALWKPARRPETRKSGINRIRADFSAVAESPKAMLPKPNTIVPVIVVDGFGARQLPTEPSFNDNKQLFTLFHVLSPVSASQRHRRTINALTAVVNTIITMMPEKRRQ